MSSNFIYYVYILIDPRSDMPFYVGKGKGNRATAHMAKSSLRAKTRKNGTIKSIIKEGKSPVIQYHATNLSEDDALRLEHHLIVEYGRRDLGTGILCNHTNGGEGFGIARTFSAEHRAKLSALRTHNNTVNNPSKTPEVRKRKSEMLKGRKSPMEGRHHTPETKEKISSNRKVHEKLPCQYCEQLIFDNRMHVHLDLCSENPNADKEKITLHKMQAKNASTVAARRVICECCKQEVPWSMYKRYHGPDCRPRIQVNGQTFVTLTEAATKLNIPPQTIADQLKGRTKNFNERIWEAHYI